MGLRGRRTIASTTKKKDEKKIVPDYNSGVDVVGMDDMHWSLRMMDYLKDKAGDAIDWTGDKIKSGYREAGRMASDEPELAATAIGTIDDALKRARMDKLAAVDAATAPWTGQKISDLASRGSLGAQPIADIAEGIAGREKRIERDRMTKLMDSYFRAKTNQARKAAGQKPLPDPEE